MQMNDMNSSKKEARKHGTHTLHNKNEKKFTCLLWYLMKHEGLWTCLLFFRRQMTEMLSGCNIIFGCKRFLYTNLSFNKSLCFDKSRNNLDQLPFENNFEKIIFQTRIYKSISIIFCNTKNQIILPMAHLQSCILRIFKVFWIKFWKNSKSQFEFIT